MRDSNTTARSGSAGNGLISGITSRISRMRHQSSLPQLPPPVSAGAAYPNPGDPFDTKDPPAQPLLLLCPSPAIEASYASQGVQGAVDPNFKSNSPSIDNVNHHSFNNNSDYILEFNDHNDYYNRALVPSDGAIVATEQLAGVTTATATTDTKTTPVLLNSFLPVTHEVLKTTNTSAGSREDSESIASTVLARTLSSPSAPSAHDDLQRSSEILSIPPSPASLIPSVALDPTLDTHSTAPPESSLRPVELIPVRDVPFHPPPRGPCKPVKVEDDIRMPSAPPPAAGQSSGKRDEKSKESRGRFLLRKRAKREDPESVVETDEEEGQAKMTQDPTRVFSMTEGASGIQIGTANGIDDRSRLGGLKWRWHLQQGTDLVSSALVPSEWSALLEIDNINRGWYSVVICISFENEGNSAGRLVMADFDVCQLEATNRLVYAEKTCCTVAKQEELSHIKSGEEKRIRLHRQIELSQGGSFVRVTAMLRGLNVKIAKVHYIELQQGDRISDDGKSDLVLYGEGRPNEVILAGYLPDEAVREHLTIHSYDVSAHGTHAATFGFNSNKEAVVEVWSLLPSLNITPSARNEPKPLHQPPVQHTLPLARAIINTPDVNNPNAVDICLSISADGQQVAIHSKESLQNRISCHVFTVNTNNNKDKGGTANTNNNKGGTANNEGNSLQSKSSRTMLTPMSLPRGLQNFFGHGTFHLMNMESTRERSQKAFKDEEFDWYVTSDGISVSVYEIVGDWSMVRNIAVGFRPHQGAALDAISSLRGRYFAWTGNEGVLSIWDLSSGQQVSYFKVEGGNASTKAYLSRDGSLVAVSVKGAITVHETATGVKLRSYPHGLGENNSFEILLEKYHAMVLDQLPPKDAKEKMVERKIVAVSDMSVVRTYRIHRDYSVRSPVPASDQIFSYSQQQGSVVNIIRMGTELISAPVLYRPDDDIMTLAKVSQLSRAPQLYTSAAGNIFEVTSSTSDIYDAKMTLITIKYAGTTNQPYTGPVKTLTIPLGSSRIQYPAIFMKATSRLAIVAGRYLQVWKLHGPGATDPKGGSAWGKLAELELSWALQSEEKEKYPEDEEKYQEDGQKHQEDKEKRQGDKKKFQDTEKYQDTDICKRKINSAFADMKHGEQFLINLRPARWMKSSGDEIKGPASESIEVVTVPMSSKDTLSISLQDRVKQGIRGVVDIYINGYGDKVCRRAILRYLRTLVRPSDDNPVSCIVTLCQFWKPEELESFEEIMKDLLPTNYITWVPASSPQEKGKDPLVILMKTAETQPAAIGVAKVIIDYCVSHAISSRNMAFLAPIFKSMRGLMGLFPEEAFECLNKVAYIPVKDRSYILKNQIITRPPYLRFQFWKPEKKVLLSNKQKPIMQFHVTTTEPDALNGSFTLDIFIASFDALWFYHDDQQGTKDKETKKERWRTRHMTIRNEGRKAVATTAVTRTISRWTTFLYMVKLKLRLSNKTYVECYDFDVEFFDNPAIAALVEYKWNTMGFWYWLGRFIFQCIYYTLIIVAAILQVYLPDPKFLFGVFVAIIVMAAFFVWLEILQAYQAWNKYKRSTYNFLDLLAFLIPMAASIDQIVLIVHNDQNGDAHLLSFSVLIIFLHVLFELRINKSVCKYVTIIQQAVAEMKIFFVIFAAGIFAFAIGMLHLIHACPTGGCISVDDEGADTGSSGFPKNFLHALSSTYFFMGGLYDPVSDKFNTDDWAFHIMMAIYFFFTVILMLNVLIALINVAFTKGDDGWRLTWVESRLRYIESAENMSYHIPDYRASYNCFPEEIYFSATREEVKAYQQRYRKKYGLKKKKQFILVGENSTKNRLITEVEDGPTLDAGGAEGGRKTETRNEKNDGDQGNEDNHGRKHSHSKNDDNKDNTEHDETIQRLESKIQSLQEQSERQFQALKEQSEKQLEELKKRSDKQLEELMELLRRR
ncbi:hypothetical protein BGZ99_005283 [Dissophora globulifera]|uniref:Ion transport domain-containing protein n=1 Tax=Dissophora globulifera TaxID=979702 RepID=A0A9P6RK85_9FUNG|nr:hypothetical protein BGZ99_005283 [Dissophora globulifera]